ncbi:MAG TPA: membrane protein insertion efficiency factor YidD [Thermoanaerobaculia bacterium]
MGPGKGRRALVIAACALLLVAAQLFGTRPALFAIDQYRAHISPHLRGIVQCRFEPTCSYYGRESIRKHGLLIGGAKTAWRIARCGPWTPPHTPDPP